MNWRTLLIVGVVFGSCVTSCSRDDERHISKHLGPDWLAHSVLKGSWRNGITDVEIVWLFEHKTQEAAEWYEMVGVECNELFMVKDAFTEGSGKAFPKGIWKCKRWRSGDQDVYVAVEKSGKRSVVVVIHY